MIEWNMLVNFNLAFLSNQLMLIQKKNVIPYLDMTYWSSEFAFFVSSFSKKEIA